MSDHIDELKGTNRDTATAREKILERNEDALNMVNEYMEDLRDGLQMHPGEWVSTYIAKAEGLIELLEIHDCGSTGGFDAVVGDSLHGLLYLEERFEALKRKHVPTKKKNRGA